MSNTARLKVRDNVFKATYPKSFVFTSITHLEVVGNAFSINAIKAVSTSGASSLYISCNRLVGR